MHRYWIIGGEFESLGFDEIVRGTERLIGPFGSRDEAELTWRDVSEAHRARCTVRFTIVQENAQQNARAA
jgi:hypothetical protein